ncbi:MAG: MFS transporter, partial [Xanthobacteraceae bacterium]
MSATYAASTFPTASEEAAGLDARRWWALPVILIGSFLAFLDFFIVNIALPTMQTDLGARPAQLQLVVAAYG